MRSIKQQKTPIALAAGLLEDGKRFLFFKLEEDGRTLLEIPFVFVFEGKNPVFLLKDFFRATAKLDVEIREILASSQHNIGSRRHKRWVPVLAFATYSKNPFPKVSAPYTGYKWVSLSSVKEADLSRNSRWLLLPALNKQL